MDHKILHKVKDKPQSTQRRHKGHKGVYIGILFFMVIEPSLCPLWLSKIELGSNFTIKLEYSIDPSEIGITNAIIELNFSTSDYFVYSMGIDGEYFVNVSTSSISAAGSIDIRINSSRSLYETQEIVTRIQILPRNVLHLTLSH